MLLDQKPVRWIQVVQFHVRLRGEVMNCFSWYLVSVVMFPAAGDVVLWVEWSASAPFEVVWFCWERNDLCGRRLADASGDPGLEPPGFDCSNSITVERQQPFVRR